MANVLIVSGSYFPNATANAVCMKKYEDALREAGHSIVYCNRKNNLNEPDNYFFEGTELFTIGNNSDLFYQTIEKLRHLDLPDSLQKSLHFSILFQRCLTKLFSGFASRQALRNINHRHYIKRYAERLLALIRTRKIDAVISVSMPFDSHLAVLHTLEMLPPKERPKWLSYSIDATWSKAGIPKETIPQLKSEEHRIFQACDHILLLDTIQKDYRNSEYDSYRNKMTALPLPIFDLQEQTHYQDGIPQNASFQNWVFTGTIYDDFRRIDEAITLLHNDFSVPVRMHFIGKIYPKALQKIQKLQEELGKDRILIYGRTPFSFAKGSMEKADVLVNFANDNTNQIPSKIFEYMKLRKPILNFYKLEEDTGTFFLRKYPLAFNFNDMRQLDEVKAWLNTVPSQQLSMDELQSTFAQYTTPVVCKNFIQQFQQMLTK